MDIGLVCDKCEAFNPMASSKCASCGQGLSLDPMSQDGPHQRIQCGTCGTIISPGFRFCGGCGAMAPPSARAPAAPAAIPAASAGGPAAGNDGGVPNAAIPSDQTGRARSGPARTMFFGAMQAARAKLVLIKGDGLDGVSFTLAGTDHVAGRQEGPLRFQEDPFLSPRHANFCYRNGKLHVVDEGSANGIFVRISARVPIRSGDQVLVGEQVLRIEATPPENVGLGPDAEGTYFYASPRRASKLRLVQLLRGGATGSIHRASGDVVTVGREGNDINFPNDPFISGKHAQVSFTDAGLHLADLGSKNGTFLRVGGEAELKHGDYVFMGQQLLRVEIVS